jgi:hypothetical protein
MIPERLGGALRLGVEERGDVGSFVGQVSAEQLVEDGRE